MTAIEDPYAGLPPVPAEDDPEPNWSTQMVSGAQFVLDLPPGVPAVWGSGTDVLWAEGEALMITGPQGVGKTTLIGQVLRALLGLSDDPVLGLPILPQGRVLYLAMDRPRQIARSLHRTFSSADRTVLEDRLVIWQGPPPQDIAANTGLLLNLAEDAAADVVIIDSLKDAAIGLSKDEVAAAYNRARQAVLRSGRQIAELHHIVKRREAQVGPPGVGDVYGSTWLTSGAGSVVMLNGEPGDPIVSFRHLKQPADEVGPFRLLHDQDTGRMSIDHQTDILALVRQCGSDGLSAKMAAAQMFETLNPDKSTIEKARRRLDRMVTAGLLVKIGGERGGNQGTRKPAAWFLAEHNHAAITGEDITAGQGNHGLFAVDSNHEPIMPITDANVSAGQGNHGSNHGNHGAPNHADPPPFIGRVGGGRRRPK